MLLFDIGANRGDATVAALAKGYTKVIACEPAPKIFSVLARTFIYRPEVVPLKVAVSDVKDLTIMFYEADEDGLSTLNKEWLTAENMPYKGKPYREIKVNTTTIDALVKTYGVPDLIKIDVEGAEWSVFRGMTKKYGIIAFEWTEVTLPEHEKQLEYLAGLGYTHYSYQFIEHHLQEPTIDWILIGLCNQLSERIENAKSVWELEGWKVSGLRQTADVGMVWVK